MRKQEFMDQLQKKLSDLPEGEVAERLGFYSEMIDDRMEEGLSEEEAVAAIGSADEIAAQIIEDAPFARIVKEKLKPKRRLNAWETVLLVLGFPIWFSLLAVVPFAVIVSLFASLWAVIVSLWAVFASLVGSAVGGCVGGIGFVCTSHVPTGIALVGAGFVCAGLSVFCFFGCKAATRGAVLLTGKTVLGIKHLFIGKEKAQ